MFGLTTLDVRRIAFELAEHEQLHVPHRFSRETKLAGLEWMRGFLKRNSHLSIRLPQATNLSRPVGFNKQKVSQFYTVLKDCLLSGPKYDAASVWNVEESGITSVQKPYKILATRGKKQVSKMTSGERGSTVTIVCAMTAAGQFVPPMMIWPRKRMIDALMRGAPPGAIAAVSDNGWTDGELFVTWLKHFIAFTKS